MSFNHAAAAALVFGALYLALWCYMAYMYSTRQYKWASRTTVLFVHTSLRVASQACGVAFGVLAWDSPVVFVVYLLLGAEGYITLTIAAFYFLHHYLLAHFGALRLLRPDINSLTKNQEGLCLVEMILGIPLYLPWRYWPDDRIAIVDAWLIPGNALIVGGGVMMAAKMDVKSPEHAGLTVDEVLKRNARHLATAKVLRTAGYGVFLVLIVVYCGFIVKTWTRPGRSNSTLVIVTIVAMLLFIRGVFGVLQSSMNNLSYYNPSSYRADGMAPRFTAMEYCLAVVPEFACLTPARLY
ncbi:uncharacterized protein LOC62_07G009826 [Vanrija pseudolonga]|uniref:Uncharacterized protein n=1 Tax=Vanrija pseudolonga TaxID=143232 RepID=A0AAF0YG84_9TREE|nr:hypothetical protein LOC62_07G009826 [Vanrija pseudolonga]